MKPVWIVDDDRSIRWVIEKALSREGIAFNSFSSAQDALEALSGGAPEVLVSDVRMPGLSGLELMQTVKQRHPAVPVIVMTAYSDLDSAVAAFQGGAYEYLPKPFDVDQAVELIRRALDESRRDAEAAEPLAQAPEILGHAPAMQEVFRAIGRLSQSSATVLITGESGTGKELVARALHRHGARASRPFIAINTAAMPKDLLESELFGHERGAFTGAVARRVGRFEEAQGGTLLLDEVSEMEPRLQAKLLRAIQEREIDRVGGTRAVKVDIRLVATSNRDLEQAVGDGTFREDLLFRLGVLALHLPPLRDRPGDVAALARHLATKLARANGLPDRPVSAGAIGRLVAQPWRGNVRELENCVHRAVILARGESIEADDIHLGPPRSLGSTARPVADGSPGLVGRTVAEVERSLIVDTLRHTLGNRTHAAAILGISIRTLRNKLHQYSSEGLTVPPAAPDRAA
jgi:two-component system, NtrC family, nitrogen regulation response regulator GlnG